MANQGGDTVSVINVAIGAISSTIYTVGSAPSGVAISPNGATAYVTAVGSGAVSVIDRLQHRWTDHHRRPGTWPFESVFNPDQLLHPRAYVGNYNANAVSVIDTSTNTIVATISGLLSPSGLAVTPNGATLYVTNRPSGNGCR